MRRADRPQSPEVSRAAATTEAVNRSQAGRKEKLLSTFTKRMLLLSAAVTTSGIVFPVLALPATAVGLVTWSLTGVSATFDVMRRAAGLPVEKTA